MSLFYPLFNIENGIQILDNQTKLNNDINDLILFHPTAQQTLDTPLTYKLIQSRKTKNSTNGGAQYCGLGERADGNTISPNRRHCGREDAYYANDFTWAVGIHRSLPHTILQLMATCQEEQRSGQKMNCLTIVCDQQRLMQAPMITNLLTQDLLDDSDNAYSGEAV